jgi:hypothetical protein
MALLLSSLHIKNTNLHHHPLHFNNNPGEKTPKLRNLFYSKCQLPSRVFHPTLAYGSTECSSYPASSGPKRTSRRKRVAASSA